MDEGSACVRLVSSNYFVWKVRMEDLLYDKGLHEPIEGDEARPPNKTDEEWNLMHRKAVAVIRLWIDRSLLHHVKKETRADVLWEKLKSLFEPQIPQNKFYLIRKLVSLKYKDGQSLFEHASVFQCIVNQLTSMNIVLDDEFQALLLLSSLPDGLETLVDSVINSTQNGKVTLDMVKNKMLNEEYRWKDSSKVDALVFGKQERRGRSQSKNSCSYQKNETQRGRSKSRRRNIRCYHCNKVGHMKRECSIWKREQSMRMG